MRLTDKQAVFTRNIARLIEFAYSQGFALSFGNAYRSQEEAARLAALGSGSARSLHCERLAVDFNLFRDGEFLDTTEAHQPLGDYWKSLHTLNAWGGDFRPKPDGNHYSMTHDGRK